MKQGYYETLNVPQTASNKQIRDAYRTFAKQWHPDVNKSKKAPEKFIQGAEAYEILSNPEKRKLYDKYGHTSNLFGSTDFKWHNFSHFNDFPDIFTKELMRELTNLFFNILKTYNVNIEWLKPLKNMFGGKKDE